MGEWGSTMRKIRRIKPTPTPSNGRPTPLPPSSNGTPGYQMGDSWLFTLIFLFLGIVFGILGTHSYLTRSTRILVGEHVTNGLCQGYVVMKYSGFAEVKPWTCKGMELSYANVDYEELEPAK